MLSVQLDYLAIMMFANESFFDAALGGCIVGMFIGVLFSELIISLLFGVYFVIHFLIYSYSVEKRRKQMKGD